VGERLGAAVKREKDSPGGKAPPGLPGRRGGELPKRGGGGHFHKTKRGGGGGGGWGGKFQGGAATVNRASNHQNKGKKKKNKGLVVTLSIGKKNPTGKKKTAHQKKTSRFQDSTRPGGGGVLFRSKGGRKTQSYKRRQRGGWGPLTFWEGGVFLFSKRGESDPN